MTDKPSIADRNKLYLDILEDRLSFHEQFDNIGATMACVAFSEAISTFKRIFEISDVEKCYRCNGSGKEKSGDNCIACKGRGAIPC